MADANLSAARLRELLDYAPDTGLFRSNGKTVGFLVPPKNYMRVLVAGRQRLAHRLAWLYVHGEWPAGQIDHINGIKTDNRIANLRCVTAEHNMQNARSARSSNKSCGLLGVTMQKKSGKKWVAQISAKGVNRYLGRYDTPEEAHVAYVEAKRRLHDGCTI
jgi:hypothetical protein